MDATNWRAEQAIRPPVVTRKVCGGNRARKGADTQQILASVVRTARQRNLDLPLLFGTILRAARPRGPRRIRPSAAARASGSAATTALTRDRERRLER